MRIISIIVAILLLVLAGIPWVDGLFFKQQYLSMMANITQANPQVVIKVQSYHVGWLSSDIQVSAQSSGNNQPNPSMIAQHTNVLINQHVMHGPLVYDEINQRWALAMAFIQGDLSFPGLVVAGPSGSPSLHWNMLATFAGDYFSKINVPAFSTTFANGSKLSLQGVQGNSQAKVENGKLASGKGDVTINGLSFSGTDNSSLVAKKIGLQYEMIMQASGLSNGFYHLAVPSVALGLPSGGAVSISDIGLQSTFGEKGTNAYSSSLQLSLGQLTAPVFSINQSNIKFSLDNVNAKEFENFLTGVAALEQQPPSPERNNQLIALLPPLFMANTAINQSAVINTSFGKILSDGQLSWPSGVNTRQDIISHIKAVKNLRVSISLVNKVIDLMYPNQPTEVIPSQPSNSMLAQQIDTWVQAKQIQIDVGVKLKDLITSHLSTDDFATNIDQFVVRKDMPANLAEQLKTQYTAVLVASKNPAPKPVHVATQADEMKAKIEGWVNLGYITRDQSDYVTALTFEQGVLKANGVQVDLGNGS